MEVVKLQPNWAQQILGQTVAELHEARRPIRIVILKARQLGMSTWGMGLLFWWAWLHPYLHALVAAHEDDPSKELFQKIVLMWEQFPYRTLDRMRNLSAGQMRFDKRGSQIRVATAKNVTTGRSMTIHAAWLTEVAFYADPGKLMYGLKQSIPYEPGTIVVLESTANGMGNYFHGAWEAAVAGDSEYVPLFFPWQFEPEYTASHISMPIAILGLTKEEKRLRSIGVDDDHLAWRRFKIANDLDGDEEKFRQEYPATPEEAFIASGANVFPLDALRTIHKPVKFMQGELTADPAGNVTFQPAAGGRLRVYLKPTKDRARGIYLAAGDPTHTTKGDFGCVQVINRRTYEQCATWHGHIDPMGLATVMRDLGVYYNHALLCPENTGPGYATAGALFAMNYPNMWINKHNWSVTGFITDMPGWAENVKSKEFAVGFLRRLVLERQIALHDERTFSEMKNYVHLGGQQLYGPAENVDREDRFDDTVMALAIACAASNLQGGIMPYEEATKDAEAAQKAMVGELIAGVHGWPGQEG